MTPEDRDEIEALAEQVCPRTYLGQPCERDEPHPLEGRHWNPRVNWPDDLSDKCARLAG